MELDVENTEAKPGDTLSIQIKSKPKSVVSLGIYDQKVELLREPNVLSMLQLGNQLMTLIPSSYYPDLSSDQDLRPSDWPTQNFVPSYDVIRSDGLERLNVRFSTIFHFYLIQQTSEYFEI